MIAHLYKRGALWHAKVKLNTWTTVKRFTLGTTDRRAASVELEQRLRDYEAVEQGRLSPLTCREAAQWPLESLCEGFLTEMQTREKSAATVKKYRTVLRVVRAETGWTRLADVSESAVRAWFRDSTLRATSRNAYLAVWRRLFWWLKRQRLVVENVCDNIDAADTHKTEREYRRALTAAEVQRFLALAPAHRRLVYRLVLETGLRRTELRNLRVGDFFLPAGGGIFPGFGGAKRTDGECPAAVERSETGTAAVNRAGGSPPPAGEGEGARGRGFAVRVPASIAKNRRSALLPLSVATAYELRAFIGEAAPFACPFATCIPRGATIRRDLARAGIASQDALERRVDLHSLRKTFGVALVLAGGQPRVVMEAMRHSDLKLTMKTYMDAAQLQGPVEAAVATLPWQRDQVPAKCEKA